MGSEIAGDPWPGHARQWALIGPPLRPCLEDLAPLEAEAARWGSEHGLRVLLLGVTPEIARLRWPAGTSLTAVDRSQAMIDAVFPRSGVPERSEACCAEWSALPFEAGAFDLVVGDGCFTLLDFPRGVGAAVAECHRVLAKEGRFVIRLFAAPEHREPLAAVARDLTAGHIGSFHILKWRLAMALEPSAALGVRLGDIWDAFAELCPDRVALAVQRGWPREVIATIDNYRGSDIRYTFPRVAEVRVLLADAWRELACHVPGYELGDRCPTLVFERRG